MAKCSIGSIWIIVFLGLSPLPSRHVFSGEATVIKPCEPLVSSPHRDVRPHLTVCFKAIDQSLSPIISCTQYFQGKQDDDFMDESMMVQVELHYL